MKITDIPSQTLHEYTAQNQMRLLYAAVPENPLICLQLYIRTGSVHESSVQRGYAHFLEHLVFKNTARYPNNSLSLAASECGAVL
ncbi:MAG TPA: insulinase family protein, partial [Candidatus Cloacimonadota bacterium]|nr:insulinase family protein [Candidatus Cloacimonadota bacterium]